MFFLCVGLGFFQCSFWFSFMTTLFFQCAIHVLFLDLLQLHHQQSFPLNVHLQLYKSLSVFFAFLQLHKKWFFLLDFLLQLHRQHFFSCVYIYVLLVVIPLQFYLVIFIFFSFFLLCFPICEVHIVSFQGYIKSNSNFML